MTEHEEMLALANEYEAGLQKCAASGYEEYGPDFQRRQQLIITALRRHAQRALPEDWRDDPSSDERWNAGVDCVMKLLCDYLGVDPNAVTWDAATETVDGDISAVIGNILRAKFGEDWSPATVTSTDCGGK